MRAKGVGDRDILLKKKINSYSRLKYLFSTSDPPSHTTK